MRHAEQPSTRVVGATLCDIRSVFDSAVRLPLGDAVTVLVGPHRSGSTTVLFAIAAGLDAAIRFIPDRDLPRDRGGTPQVIFATADGTDITVGWDSHRGTRTATAEITTSVVYATVTSTPRDLVRRLLGVRPAQALRLQLADELLSTMRRVIPEATTVDIGDDGTVVVGDEIGVALPIVAVRALAAIACARFLGKDQRLSLNPRVPRAQEGRTM